MWINAFAPNCHNYLHSVRLNGVNDTSFYSSRRHDCKASPHGEKLSSLISSIRRNCGWWLMDFPHWETADSSTMACFAETYYTSGYCMRSRPSYQGKRCMWTKQIRTMSWGWTREFISSGVNETSFSSLESQGWAAAKQTRVLSISLKMKKI